MVKAAGSRLFANLKIAVLGCDVVDCAEPPGAYWVADVAVPEGFRAAVALTGPTRFVVEAAGWPGGVVEAAGWPGGVVEAAGWPGREDGRGL